MSQEIKHLHHIGHVVSHMESALKLYRRIGFDCPAPAYPALPGKTAGDSPKPLGAGNTHANFQRNFIEIITVVQEGEKLPDHTNIVPLQVPPDKLSVIQASMERTVSTISNALSRFEGTHILCLHSTDLEATAARLDQARIGNSGAQIVKRPVDTTNGMKVVPVHYLEIDGEILPEGRLAVAENPPEEIMLTQTHMEHPNGAVELREIYLCVEDARMEEFELRYQRYLGCKSRDEGGCRSFVLDDGGCITLVPISVFPKVLPGETPPPLPGFAGYAVAVRDIAKTQAFLEAAEIRTITMTNGDIMVPSSVGLGTAIVFRKY